MPARVMVLGLEDDSGLLSSYGRAFKALGAETSYFDLHGKQMSHARFGAAGRTLSRFIAIEPWIAKANRDLVTTTIARAPDLLACTSSDIRAGAIAQIKVSSPKTKVVLIWPDMLQNLTERLVDCLRVVDVVATYSEMSIPMLERLGARKVIWTPFAMDTSLFPDVELTAEERVRYASDLGFVGNHRPERERDVLRMLDAGLRVKVWGLPASWGKWAARKDRLSEYFQGEPLTGKELVKALRGAVLAVNMIDPTNYPAANMRFFETYAARATPLCSRCPEMEDVFREGESAFYFDPDDLVDRAAALLKDRAAVRRVGEAGRRIAESGHFYHDRARAILDACQVSHGE
jgi:glycosyltransferase involved in cell wall biosynthesis